MNETIPCFLGIDVAKAKLDCALPVVDGSKRKYLSKTVPNTPEGYVALIDWLAKKGATAAPVCLEATGVYWEDAALALTEAGFTVAVVNPALIAAFAGINPQHMNRAAASAAGRTSPRSAMPTYGARSTCPPWSHSTKPRGSTFPQTLRCQRQAAQAHRRRHDA